MGLPTLPCTCSTVCSAIEEKLDAYELFDADRARFASGELRSGLHARGCRPRISERLLARLNLTLPERLPASPRSSWPGHTRCSPSQPTLSASRFPRSSFVGHGAFPGISEICTGSVPAASRKRLRRQLPRQAGEHEACCARYSSRPSARHCPQSLRYVPGSVFDGMARDGQPARTAKVERCRQLRCPVSSFGSLGCFW